MADTVVFVGPSLPQDQAAGLLDASVRPPAEQGAIVEAVRDGARLLVVIDGLFGTAPAVRHKEILWAMSRGVLVCGAASMGALRAAELAPFGMAGHGLVYRWFRATPLADDDEVAVATAPAELGSFALGEALVDIRRSLARAARAGAIGQQARHGVAEAARRLHFTDRTWDAVLDAAARHPPGLTRRERAAILQWRFSQKAIDARSLLLRIAAGWRPSGARPSFSLTEAWHNDLTQSGIILDRIGSVIC